VSGAEVASRIRDGLLRATRSLSSDDSELTGSISRKTGADETVYPPTPGTEKSYTFVCALGDATEEDFQGSEITSRDVRVIVSRPVVASDGEETEPRNGDRMTVSGVEYSVVSVRATNFGGYDMMWSCQCRQAD